MKRSSDYVNEYPRRDASGNLGIGSFDNPNHLLGMFPWLFPYGEGGFEVDRPRSVSYEAHVQWCLRYHDKRFREDLYFVFQVFGVLQKRLLCASAALQVSKRTFLRFEREIRNLTDSDFHKASAEESARKPFSNAVMRSLRGNLTAVRSKVMGTDESCIKIRSQIWGMCVKKNPPSIWLTINPNDTQDPIAQVLCGRDIDLDKFCRDFDSPSSTSIAADPYASAAFFHFIVNAVLQNLLGIRSYNNHGLIERKTGILGTVEAYIGTVETQGRGTLHLHIVLWLKGSVTSKKMKERLGTVDFRNKIKKFICANIHAHLPGVSASSESSIPKQKNVGFSRPLDPRLPDYERERMHNEITLARTVQTHQCGLGCMKLVNTKFVCKRKAPFPLAQDDWVESDGNWGPKRSYGYLNNWNPEILQCIRANHDMKLITNGMETKDIAWYITHYVTKKRKASTNVSALLANTLVSHKRDQNRTFDLSQINKKLLQRCANTLSRQQELSAPEVISYLMGWGDRYVSHHFVTIHWYSVMSLLKTAYPELVNNQFVFFFSSTFLFRSMTQQKRRSECKIQ